MSGTLKEIFNIKPGITAIIGGGGKTSLMYALGKELAQHSRVIITTSTKIFKPDICPCVLYAGESSAGFLSKIENTFCEIKVPAEKEGCGMLAVGGQPDENGKISTDGLPFTIEALDPCADYILVEADGSKHCPLKAHDKYEPVIPKGSDQIIYVIGLSAIGKTIADACHRPQLYAAELRDFPKLSAGLDECEACKPDNPNSLWPNITEETIITPQLVGAQLLYEDLGGIYFFNQADSDEAAANGISIANMLGRPCITGSLHREVYKCLY